MSYNKFLFYRGKVVNSEQITTGSIELFAGGGMCCVRILQTLVR